MALQPGKPLTLEALLPFGMSADDFYTILAGVAAFLVIVSIGSLFVQRDLLGPRLKALQERRNFLKSQYLAPRKREKPATSVTFMWQVVNRLQLLKKDKSAELTALLVSAGMKSKDAIVIYTFFKLVLPFAFLLLCLMLMKFDFTAMFASKWKWAMPFFAMYVGYKMPDILVINNRNKRWAACLKGLPDTLDLMMICAEAGLSLAASLDRVGKELGGTYPELADELGMTSVELGFYPDRKKALTNLSERLNIPEIRGMVSVLIQTEKYGTPISQALRALATEFRTQRMLRAEQKAARLPAIMTVPMILFILPCLFIVVIAPAAIQLLDSTAK